MKNLLYLIFVLLIAGCTTTNSYNIRVNSFSDKDAKLEKYSFYILSKEKNDSGLEFKEYAGQVRKILEKKGNTFSDDIKTCDVVVFLSYSIDNGKTTTNTNMIPIYGGSQYTSTIQNSAGQNIGSIQTGPQNPYMPTGYQTTYSSETNFTRQITLSGYKRSTNTPIWETKITSTGSSDDLRKVFPIMLIGSSDEIGTNTHGIKNINLDISPNNAELRFLNGARRPSSPYLDE